MADWIKPNNSDPVHVNVLQELADKDTYSGTMGQTGSYTNRPEGFMIWDNVAKLFKRLTGAVETAQTLSLAGGGTGASDAAGVRTSINVNEAGAGSSQARTNAQADAINAPLTRQISTTSPVQGGGTLEADRTISIQDATTGQKGATQLNNTLTSALTSQALTAAQGKILKDAADSLAVTVSDYFQDSALGASGGLQSGSCKVSRSGNIITIFGSYTFPSAQLVSSAGGFIPAWARPTIDNAMNAYEGNGFLNTQRQVTVSTSGLLSFVFSAADTKTSGFTISYTI